jgi:hypothetical protein
MQAAVYRVLGVRVELVVVLLDGYFKGMTRLSFFPSSVFLSLSKLRYKRSNGSTDRLRLTRVTFPIGRGGDNKQLWWKTRLVGSPFHRRAMDSRLGWAEDMLVAIFSKRPAQRRQRRCRQHRRR